jgi:hypothetical protein
MVQDSTTLQTWLRWYTWRFLQLCDQHNANVSSLQHALQLCLQVASEQAAIAASHLHGLDTISAVLNTRVLWAVWSRSNTNKMASASMNCGTGGYGLHGCLEPAALRILLLDEDERGEGLKALSSLCILVQAHKALHACLQLACGEACRRQHGSRSELVFVCSA